MTQPEHPGWLTLAASRVRMGPDGEVAQRPAWSTGDPERPWCCTMAGPGGRFTVHLLTEHDVAGWAPMHPFPAAEDDQYEREILTTWGDDDPAQ